MFRILLQDLVCRLQGALPLTRLVQLLPVLLSGARRRLPSIGGLTSTVLKRVASFGASTLFLGIAGAAATFDIDD